MAGRLCQMSCDLFFLLLLFVHAVRRGTSTVNSRRECSKNPQSRGPLLLSVATSPATAPLWLTVAIASLIRRQALIGSHWPVFCLIDRQVDSIRRSFAAGVLRGEFNQL